MKVFRTTASLCVAVGLLSFGASTAGAQTHTLKFNHVLGPKEPYHDGFLNWAKRVEELGAGEIVLTSMDCDGTKDGYDLAITEAVSKAVSIPVVASGGAGCPEHLADAVLIGRADAALAASIFHFGEYTIRETKLVMANRGIPVRL